MARAEARQVYYHRSGVGDGELVVTTTLDAPIPGTRLAIRGEEPEKVAIASDTDTEVLED